MSGIPNVTTEKFINPIQVGDKNVGIQINAGDRPKNILTFSYNPFATLM